MAVKITAPPPKQDAQADYWPPPQGQWTYEDYLRLPDNEMRYEIIKGDLFMSPAPRPIHQEVIIILLKHILTYLDQQPVGKNIYCPHQSDSS